MVGLTGYGERKNKNMDYRKYITLEPGKRSGQPCIRNLRITVGNILSYLASGMTTEEILEALQQAGREFGKNALEKFGKRGEW